jgi:hypothetical protein
MAAAVAMAALGPLAAGMRGVLASIGSASTRRSRMGARGQTSGYRTGPPRTVAQDKRDAVKRRNRLRHRRAMNGL